MKLDEGRGVRVCREQVLPMVKREAAGSDSDSGRRLVKTRKENELILGFVFVGQEFLTGVTNSGPD